MNGKQKTTKRQTVLLLGSGALKIGEAGEFDYSGTQAIKALKEEGKRVVLMNPNIATIQTSRGLADAVYFLPVTAEFAAKVIERERPSGILLSFGGQTALNCGLALDSGGVLEQFGVTVLGTPIQAILDTEDRKRFSDRLQAIGTATARGRIVGSLDEANAFAAEIGYPLMLRAGFALGGSGSKVIRTEEELTEVVVRALATTSQIVIEEDLSGWKEFEYEVVRDAGDNCIVVCTMENFDPVGIHTGESIVVAPAQTLTDREYYRLRDLAIRVIRDIGIVGECNIQFAVHPKTGEVKVIEVNARLSRSSALASKATGYPLAYVSAKCALGKLLPEIPNSVTGKTTACFEPSLDYCVVKIPRWDLAKFDHAITEIGSEMKSVGEVMSIGRSFEEALQKAVRMLSQGREGVWDDEAFRKPLKDIRERVRTPNPDRLPFIMAALARGVPSSRISRETGIDPWFLGKLESIVALIAPYTGRSGREMTGTAGRTGSSVEAAVLSNLKRAGFSDTQIGEFTRRTEQQIRDDRAKLGVLPYAKVIDTMAGEFPAVTNYRYLTYHADADDTPGFSLAVDSLQKNNSEPLQAKSDQLSAKSVIVFGCGPYAIGTSVEFDWCAVSTVEALRTAGYRATVVNCNPETVSTDFDISDTLYFEELSLERVLDIHSREQSPVIVSVGGQIPNNLAPELSRAGVRILGTSVRDITRAEHREEFSRLLDRLHIPQPEWSTADSAASVKALVQRIGFPVLLRPSFVLSGKGMSVLRTGEELSRYLTHLPVDIRKYPLVITQFLEGAGECDFDGVADRGTIVWHAVSEHIEGGGVHSGDSAMIHPPAFLSDEIRRTVDGYARRIVQELRVSGPFNIQFLVRDGTVYVIECNLRASRSMPYVSKTHDTNAIHLATRVMLGQDVPKQSVRPGKSVTDESSEQPATDMLASRHAGVSGDGAQSVGMDDLPFSVVKVPQFSFHKLRGSDPILTVEMRSTGEVAAFGRDPYEAFIIASLAAGRSYPVKKAVFLSFGGFRAKLEFLPMARTLVGAGYTLYATSGTSLFLTENSLPVTRVGKMYEGIHPNISDLIKLKTIDLAVVTPETLFDVPKDRYVRNITDGYRMRRMAVDLGVPLFTNIQAAGFFITGILKYRVEDLTIRSWQEYVDQLPR